ncbi:MAG: hypothetical protein AAF198_07450 [Pseudomonadota bacterium]
MDRLDLLARFWVLGEDFSNANLYEALNTFVEQMNYQISDLEIKHAADLVSKVRLGDEFTIYQWVVFKDFIYPPRLNWNFLVEAVDAAESDGQLLKIAIGPATNLLAHYGSTIEYFEKWSAENEKFKRMTTAMIRHRTCNDSWYRLWELQSQVPDPLSKVDERPTDRDHLVSLEDQENADKGRYRYDGSGNWVIIQR